MKRITILTSLFKCEKYLEKFFDAADQIINPEECELLLLHNSPTEEELQIINRRTAGNSFYRHIIIPKREGLYSTWNRGIQLARGKYIAVWNCDDRRNPDSLKLQADTLDQYPEAAMTYGNYHRVAQFGDKDGVFIREPAYSHKNKSLFLHSHIIGPFPMWRKNIHEKISFFDEQFRLVSDYDFQIRVAYNYPLKKTEADLGDYLQGSGNEQRLSQNALTQNLERTAVEARYRIFFKMNFFFLFEVIKHYNFSEIVHKDENIPVCKLIPRYRQLWLKKCWELIPGIFGLPLQFIRWQRVKKDKGLSC